MTETEPVTILIVDDNEPNRYAVGRVLQRAGFRVWEAATGQEGLRRATERPDLIVLDVKMPDINGFEVCRQLKANPDTASIPVLHLSASYITETDRVQGLEGGADGYLTGPVEPPELLATIHALLRARRAEAEARKSTRRLEAILESITDSYILFDRQWRITDVNPQAARSIFGRPKEDLLGCYLWQEYPKSNRSAFIREYHRAMQEGVPVHFEARSEINLRWYEVHAYPSDEGLAVYLRDIDERKRHLAEIETLNERLRRSMVETHHRVKNNLQVIAAMVDMQVMEDQPFVSVQEWHRLGRHVRALAVVHDLLTHEAKSDHEAQTVSSREIVTRLLPILQETATGRKITFNGDDMPLSTRQGTSMALIVNELTSNALKHGAGQVDVAVRPVGHSLVLEVCDEGPGFPPGFDAAQAANTGLELVLNLSRWDLAGEVRFENRPKGGARVTVTIPRSTA